MRNPLSLAITALLLAACSGGQPPASTDQPPAMAQTPAGPAAEHDTDEGHEHTGEEQVAIARLQPTAGNQVSGELMIRRLGDRLQVTGNVSGLKAGAEHGFHIHEKGDCSAPDGSSAGGHFNPGSSEHGSISTAMHHGGDMPNITANAEGVATIDAPVSSNVNIGKGDGFDIIGRGLIVHADADDYKTQPTGNAGARLACAVIKAP